MDNLCTRKLLIVTGGINPGHLRNANIFIELLNDRFIITNIELPKLTHDTLSSYDATIVFTSLESATNEQLEYFIEYSKRKSIHLYFFHEASIYPRKHLQFKEFLGVRFKTHDNYKSFTVYAKPHSLTYNLSERFEITDEFYRYDEPLLLNKNDQIFLCDKHGYPIAFERNLSWLRGKMFYISLGHDQEALTNKNFREIIQNIVRLSKI